MSKVTVTFGLWNSKHCKLCKIIVRHELPSFFFIIRILICFYQMCWIEIRFYSVRPDPEFPLNLIVTNKNFFLRNRILYCCCSVNVNETVYDTGRISLYFSLTHSACRAVNVPKKLRKCAKMPRRSSDRKSIKCICLRRRCRAAEARRPHHFEVDQIHGYWIRWDFYWGLLIETIYNVSEK